MAPVRKGSIFLFFFRAVAEKHVMTSQEPYARSGTRSPETGLCLCPIPSLTLKRTILDRFSTTLGLFPMVNVPLGIQGQGFPMELQCRALPNKEVWQSKSWTKAQTTLRCTVEG